MIKAKAAYIIRIFGFVMITSTIPITIFTDYYLLNHLLLLIFYSITIIPWIAFYISRKLTITWVLKRKKIILSSLICLLSLICIFSLVLINHSIALEDFIQWILQLIKANLLLVCWNYSFTIFRRRKVIFLTSGFLYSALTSFFLIFTSDMLNLMLISLILMILGVICILGGELIMIKKGLLNYL